MPKLDTIVSIKPEPNDKGRRKGIVRPRIEDEPWRRRLSDPLKKYLRVFDVARSAAGADINFSASQNTLSGSPFFNIGANFWDVTGNLIVFFASIDFTNEWNSYLLPHEDWPETRYEFTQELDEYGVSIDGVGDYVAGKGLEIPEDITKLKGTPASTDALKWDLLSALGQPYFPGWLDKDVSLAFAPFKLTSEPSYAASSVTLTVDRSIDVFLAPASFTSEGTARDYPIPPSPYVPQFWYRAGLQNRNVPRSAMADAIWPDVLAGRGSDFSTADQAVKEYVMDMFINNGSVPMYTVPVVDEPPSFVTGLTEVIAGLPLEADGAQNIITVTDSFYNAGSLMGAIRKHLPDDQFEWYFVWANGFWSSLSPSFVVNGRV